MARTRQSSPFRGDRALIGGISDPRGKQLDQAGSHWTVDSGGCDNEKRHDYTVDCNLIADRGRPRPIFTDPSQSADKPSNFGAGGGIRTLDPDLGKVVLYP